MAEDRVTVQEAARRLGVKDDAIRKRIQRGTIRHEKASDGRVWVYLDMAHADDKDASHATTHATTHDADREELVEVLRDQVEDLRGRLDREQEANRENRRIIAGLLERVPELEAPVPTERAPGGSESAGEAPDRGRPPEPQQGSNTRPWWRRVFGG